jgi:ribosomal protein S18 acetylase RimI-like enzyme
MDELRLRAATLEDSGFLYQLRKATMQTYVAQTWGWDELWQQARFQKNFNPAKSQVVVLNNQDIGLVSTEDKDREVILSGIYILPEYQRQGIGTQLIKAILTEAFKRNQAVSLQVLKVNPARKLYERLGFTAVGETETHHLMKALPP